MAAQQPQVADLNADVATAAAEAPVQAGKNKFVQDIRGDKPQVCSEVIIHLQPT